MTEERLAVEDAKAIIEAQGARLRGIFATWHLAFTQRPESVMPSYDTLVISVPERFHYLDAQPRPVIANTLRDVLLVLHALSGCHGFSFRDNAAFWTSALLPENPFSYWRFEIPRPTRSLPRVVLSCNYHESRSFQRNVFDIFDPDRMSEPSQSTQDLLDRLQAYNTGGVPVEPIECVVRLQLARTGNGTKDMLAQVTSHLRSIDEAQQGSVIRLTGLELVGRRRLSRPCENLKIAHLKPLQALCVNLPTSMSLALRFPHRRDHAAYVERPAIETQVETPDFGSFLERVCGLQGREFLGKLEVLDLVSAFNRQIKSMLARIDFAALCTLLPYSRCLREVRVAVSDTSDLLWLAYAMFHPQARQSAWRALVLCYDFTEQGSMFEWQVVDRFVEAGATLPALLSCSVPATIDINQDRQAGGRMKTRRTATTIKRTTVFRAREIGKLVSLARGEIVEICDTSATVVVPTFDPRDSVAVSVPGYGLGYVAKSCLSPIAEMNENKPPTSCITSLFVAALVERRDYSRHLDKLDELGLLRLFGPSLKVLRVGQDEWLKQPGFSQFLPQVETIDGCEFVSSNTFADFVALPKLRALGLECSSRLANTCFHELLIPCARNLQELRLTLRLTRDDVPTLEALLKLCLGQLRHLKVDIKINNAPKAVTLLDVSTVAGRSKLAFLGAIHRAQTQFCGDHPAALAQLDTNLIRIIFDFSGQELESLIIGGANPYEWELQTPHEMKTEGHAWNDRFADE